MGKVLKGRNSFSRTNFCCVVQAGRSDFDNIDNEALDFEQLEAFIHNNAAVVQSPAAATQPPSGEPSNQITNPTNLPESPPDSGSEPPYSPNVKGNQNLQMDHLAQSGLNMNTLTELHVQHHHNLLTPSTELYLANEHQQQLLQINNLLHSNKHDGPLLPPHHQQAPQDHMLLYQVNQSGQIIELNHIHQQQNQPMAARMYKGDIIEMENPGALPAIHDIQSSLQGNLNDNLQMMGESFTQLGNQGLTNGSGSVKKRKGASQAFVPDGDGNLKAFIKSEASRLPRVYRDCIIESFVCIFRARQALWQEQEEAPSRARRSGNKWRWERRW